MLQQPLWFPVYRQKQQVMQSKPKGWKPVVPGESVQRKPGLEEAAVTGTSVREPKAGALYGAGLSPSLCLSFPAWTVRADMADQLV